MRYLFAFTTVLALQACSTAPTKQESLVELSSESPFALMRRPASSPTASDVEQWVQATAELVRSSELNPSSCQTKLLAHMKGSLGLNPAAFSLANIAAPSRKEVSTRWLKSMFESRLALRSRAQELAAGNPDCARALKQFMVYSRYAEEYLIEAMVRTKAYANPDDDGKEHPFRGGFPATLVNPKFGKLELKVGDVLLTRGEGAISAQIARTSDVENMFAHAAIVGQDSSGKLHIVEAVMEDKLTVTPLKEWIADSTDTSLAVFRNPDAALAKKAGRFIYKFGTTKGLTTKYDFHMDDSNPDELFCSEAVQFAYRTASKGKLVLPLLRTNVDRFEKMGKRNWVRAIEVFGTSFFAPGDMDTESRFELVADYRMPDDLRGLRIDDAVMSTMFSWMLNRNYYLEFDLRDHVISFAGPTLARMIGRGDSIPSNIPKGTIRAFLEFERIFKLIRAPLEKQEESFFAGKGHSMAYSQMLSLNDEFLAHDCHKFTLDRAEKNSDLSGYAHASFNREKGCAKLGSTGFELR